MKDSKPDAFLDGKISLFQPLNGYRANSDSILLAAAVDAKKGQSILELGCGVGAVLFSLMSRVDALKVVGIEIQRKYAQLAVRNAEYNGFEADILGSISVGMNAIHYINFGEKEHDKCIIVNSLNKIKDII